MVGCVVVKKFDPDTKSIEIYGNVYMLNTAVFAKVMRVGNDGRLTEPCGRSFKIQQLRCLFNKDTKGIRRRKIEKFLDACTDGGEVFQQLLTLFLVATLLDPILGVIY